jgi:AraC-like DNA-binding protein
MVFATHVPAFPLCEFIESFVHYQGYNPVHSIDRFLPDGDTHLVIDLLDFPKYIYDNETLTEKQACNEAWFSGFRTRPITIPSGRDSEMFIIYFRKGRSHPFTGRPLSAFADHVVDAGLALPKHIYELRLRLQETTGSAAKFALAEHFLLRYFRSRFTTNPFVDFAISAITSSPGSTTIEAIAAKAGYSRKHMAATFSRHVGVTPKAFMRVMRFQQVISTIAQQHSLKWTSVANECGYFDQAHFINDFKEFSGFTPSEYIMRNSDFNNYVAMG